MVQMVQWLTRQEAVHRFTGYLQWAIPHYTVVQQDASEDTDDDNEKKPEELEDEYDKEGRGNAYIPDHEKGTISKNCHLHSLTTTKHPIFFTTYRIS